MDSNNFDCAICYGTLNEAHETLCCHQCYCKKCITDWMERSNSCPSCRQALTKKNVAPNIPVQRLVNNLPTKCPNYTRGCHEKLVRSNVDDHLNKSCKYALLRCKDCGEKLRRHAYNDHLKEDCPKREIFCRYCKVKIVHNERKAHYKDECMKITRDCTLCGGPTTLEKLDQHLAKVCPEKVITCPFSKFGCHFEGKRAAYNNHMINDAKDHVDIAEDFFTRQNETKIAKLRAELNKAKTAAKTTPQKTMVTRSSTRGKENQVNK